MANRDLSSEGRTAPSLYARDPFSLFRHQMGRLFDDFLPAEARSFAATNGAGEVWPSIDVDETDEAYCVTAELPGMKEENVEVRLEDNVLTLSGEKRDERKEESRGRTYSERTWGHFMRRIPFAAEIDADKVQANFKDGVLTIDLPKNPKAREKTRRIQIKRG